MNFIEKYQSTKIINNGAFSTLFEVKEIGNENKTYALKLMKNNLFSDYEKEIFLLKKINSRYVIKLKDNFYDKKNDGYCIVMELCDDDLRKILNKNKPKGLPLNIINKIFYQLNSVLKAMIDINYSNRNLKPENILIKYTDNNKNDFDIKLTDFGLSSFQSDSSTGKNYLAPELEENNYNNKSDLWSLGVILYELYTKYF